MRSAAQSSTHRDYREIVFQCQSVGKIAKQQCIFNGVRIQRNAGFFQGFVASY